MGSETTDANTDDSIDAPLHCDPALPAAMGDGLSAYIHAVRRLPQLSREEEQHLAKSLREKNDLRAARQLVLANLRHVVAIARGYLSYGLPLGDLIQ